jgi:L-lysine exporter family protein LysE/ArgO
MAAGLLLGLSLIVAIGAQNVYVLRQGMLREYVSLVVGICSASDVVLIAAGVAGGGIAIGDRHWLQEVARIGDALFIFGYAALAARRAWRPATVPFDPSRPATSRPAVAAACLAFTWLNPAVYLDNVVLVGSVANASPGRQWWFGGGAAVASILWFAVLGFGAGLVAPVFARPRSWRLLDIFTAVVMVVIGLRVLLAGR